MEALFTYIGMLYHILALHTLKVLSNNNIFYLLLDPKKGAICPSSFYQQLSVNQKTIEKYSKSNFLWVLHILGASVTKPVFVLLCL